MASLVGTVHALAFRFHGRSAVLLFAEDKHHVFQEPPLSLGSHHNSPLQIEAMLQGDVSFLARSLLFRACDLHRLAVMCSGEGGAEDDGELGLRPAHVEAFLKDCEMLWLVFTRVVKLQNGLRSVMFLVVIANGFRDLHPPLPSTVTRLETVLCLYVVCLK